MEHANRLHQHLLEISWKGEILMGGDWNEECESSWCGTVATLFGLENADHSDLYSTRWSGHKIIDYFFASVPLSKLSTRFEKISDRKIVSTSVSLRLTKCKERTFKSEKPYKQPSWITFERWAQLFDETFEHGCLHEWVEVCHALGTSFKEYSQSFDKIDQAIMDFHWSFLSLQLTWSFGVAAHLALCEIPPDFEDLTEIRRVEHMANHWLYKGFWRPPATRHPRHFGDPQCFRLARYRKFLGRFRELRLKLVLGLHGLSDTVNLISKLFGDSSPHPSIEELDVLIANLEIKIGKMEDSNRKHAFRDWRHRVASSMNEKSKWLHKVFAAKVPEVGTPTDRAETLEQGLNKINDFNLRLADQVRWGPLDRQRAVQKLTDHFKTLTKDISVPQGRPDLKAFKKSLLTVKGAAGIDNWSRADLQVFAFSKHAACRIWREMSRWEQFALTPSVVKHVKVVYVPKTPKIVDHTLTPDNFRPISVLSGLWRAWSKTWLRSQWTSCWANHIIHAMMSGALPNRPSPESIAAALDSQLQLMGFGVSLDYYHAFDTVDLRLVREVLLNITPPPCRSWLNTLCNTWLDLQRRSSLGGQIADKPLLLECGIPQGDSCSPLVLGALLRFGFD